jgi:hypothetical protein
MTIAVTRHPIPHTLLLFIALSFRGHVLSDELF